MPFSVYYGFKRAGETTITARLDSVPSLRAGVSRLMRDNDIVLRLAVDINARAEKFVNYRDGATGAGGIKSGGHADPIE